VAIESVSLLLFAAAAAAATNKHFIVRPRHFTFGKNGFLWLDARPEKQSNFLSSHKL